MRTLLFFVSRFVVSLADQFLLFVVPIMVYQSTQSVAWSSLSFAIETIPRVCYTPFAGIIADKQSPYKTVQRMMTIRCILCALSLGLSLLLGADYLLFIIIGLSAFIGVASTQSFISSEVLLPVAFADLPFPKVQSWTQSVDQAAIVTGPILAATVLELASWQSAIFVASLLFFVGQWSFYSWLKNSHSHNNMLPKEHNKATMFSQLNVALSIVKSNKKLLMVIAQTALVNLLFGSAMATAAAMVSGKFNLQATSFGILQMMGAITSIIVLMLTSLTLNKLSLNTVGKLSFMMICLGGALYSNGSSYVIFFLGFILVLGFDGMFNVYIRSIRQQLIPSDDYGKTTGVIVFLNNLTKPLSGIIIGALGFVASAESIIFSMVALVATIGILLFNKLQLS